jgi:SAM-dependent methyltransferase
MQRRAALEGFDARDAPEIDFVSATGDLGVVDATFDAVLSSHAIEHQPDLIAHFRHVERLLRPGGRYFAIVPDKRYCFDHFSPESSIAEIVAAFLERRTVHTLASVLGQSVMTTHNDCVRHWNGDHGNFMEQCLPRIHDGVEAFEAAAGDYVDVHAWYFTPESARTIFRVLHEARYTELYLERLYPTRRDTFEFWTIFRKPPPC